MHFFCEQVVTINRSFVRKKPKQILEKKGQEGNCFGKKINKLVGSEF